MNYTTKEISKRVEKLGDNILESNSKMHEMVNSMNEINKASKEIDKIITTINEIASQTNLLALNASRFLWLETVRVCLKHTILY